MRKLFKQFWVWLITPAQPKESKKMKLSAIEAQVSASVGKPNPSFSVKSKETGNLLKIIGKTPGGRFVAVKMSGKNSGKEVLLDDTERYALVEDAASKNKKRMEEIKAKLKSLSAEGQKIETEIDTLETELETLEQAAG